jgi:hypothetical protein
LGYRRTTFKLDVTYLIARRHGTEVCKLYFAFGFQSHGSPLFLLKSQAQNRLPLQQPVSHSVESTVLLASQVETWSAQHLKPAQTVARAHTILHLLNATYLHRPSIHRNTLNIPNQPPIPPQHRQSNMQYTPPEFPRLQHPHALSAPIFPLRRPCAPILAYRIPVPLGWQEWVAVAIKMRG